MESLNATKYVVVIPAFNESEALPLQLRSLMLQVRKELAVLIVDDSDPEEFTKTREQLIFLPTEFRERITHLGNPIKSGRGAAVKRGISLALERFPECIFILEADADGSHQASDIDLMLNADPSIDVLIGSRYLKGSKIEGWSLKRQILSRTLNFCIPKLLNLRVNDVTNGLRRYSRQAAEVLVSFNSVSSGFIHLSEQLKLLDLEGFTLKETPITFKERVAGTSTVTHRELIDSAIGLFRILRARDK